MGTYPGKLGGICATQGHLLTLTKVPADWADRGTPVRVFSGLEDSTMPWHDWVSDTYDPLRQSGCSIEFRLDEDVDHADDVAEGQWIRAFLEEMWPTVGSRDGDTQAVASSHHELDEHVDLTTASSCMDPPPTSTIQQADQFEFPQDFQMQMFMAYQEAMAQNDPTIFFRKWESMQHLLPPGVAEEFMGMMQG